LINSTTTLSQTDIIVAFMGSGFSLFYNPYANAQNETNTDPNIVRDQSIVYKTIILIIILIGYWVVYIEWGALILPLQPLMPHSI
jgi:hypothetical protein